jgi:pSer/pThr/pTyr-binding forkhead associated (FHA) protein
VSAPAETTATDTVPVTAPSASVPSSAPSTGTVQNAQLTILRGGTVGKVFPLQAGDNLVGRWDPDSGSFPEVDMEHDDPEARISRKHALIRVSDKITIEDIGSLNGTFVNRGRRLEPGSPTEVKDGDEIIVGKTFFKVSVG